MTGEGTRYAAAVAGVVGAEVAAWSGQVRAEAGAASARALVELGAWSMTALSGAVLGVRLAQAESDFAAAAGRAAAAAIAQAGAASAGLTAAFSGLAAAHTAAVAGLAVGYAGTVAGAQAEEAKAVQFADGTATIAKAQAGVTATGAVGAAAQTATSASAAASVALTAALTAAATAYVEAVAGAQRDLAKSLAAIGHAREVAGIDSAATHAHAVLSADVSRDTALAGVTLDFSQRRTALSLKIATAGADLVQAKMIQSAVEGTKASLEATERAWNEWIATLHERRSAGYGFLELVSVGGGLMDMAAGAGLMFASAFGAIFSGGALTPFSMLATAAGGALFARGFDTAWTSLGNAMYGTSHRTGFQQILDRFTGSAGLSNMIDFGLSMATGAGVAKLGRLMNMVDDAGRCMSFLTRLNLGLCFTGDTLVHVTSLAGDTAPADHAAWPSLDDEGVSAVTVASAAAGATATLVEPVRAAAAASFTLPIRDVPLGSRVLAGNPRPEEFDETWSEPEQATWVRVGLALVKADGTPVTAEFLRPREWVDRLGLRAGAPLPIAVTELEVEGDALVTSIAPCPPIAEGAGRVVTGRFATQAAGNLVRVLLADGTEIRATDVHPVWSVDREEWVPAGELLFGEVLDTLAGPVAVERVERLESPQDVYNIEVHGEHVFRVTADGVLVHNSCLRANMIAAYGDDFMKGKHAAHIIPQNGWSWADPELHSIIARVKKAGLIDDVANGFAATAGHKGTHTKTYVNQVIETMRDRFSRDQLLAGIAELREMIEAGVFT